MISFKGILRICWTPQQWHDVFLLLGSKETFENQAVYKFRFLVRFDVILCSFNPSGKYES